MNQLLTIVFVLLLLFITAEAGFLLLLNRQSSNPKSPTSKINNPTSNLQPLTLSPFLSSRLFNVSNILTAKTTNNEEVKYIFGLVIEEINKGIFVFKDRGGKQYTGKITDKTSYFKNIKIRTSTDNEFLYDQLVKPFNLKKGKVYLLMFDGLKTSAEDVIIIDKIIKNAD